VTVTVPDVTGIKYETAQTRLVDLGLKVERKDAFHATVKKGYVISQDKQKDVLVNAGTTITLTVSKGIERVIVPDVKGKTQADATQILTAAGFTATPQLTDSDTVPAGQVISQTPESGTKAEKGSAVTIAVSNGPKQFPMPDVRGMSFSEAKAKLESLGLVVKREQVPGSYGDTVVGQKPSKGQTVKRGTTATLFTA
jgi:beta-lactam-binding protein with PASTA domain